MSSSARGASDIAAKLSRLRARKFSLTRPLAQQLVAPDDSRLGKPFSRWPEPGLRDDYATMIRAAFRREWWDSAYSLRVNDDGSITPFVNKSAVLKDNEYALMEYNFSLFFGLAIQLYESTLASDDTRYDRWREGYGTITDQEFHGLLIFLSVDAPYIDDNGNLRPGTNEGARCINCHAGPAFTDASIMTIANPDPESGTVRRKREGQEIDRGFNNIGVRPTLEDLGVGGMDTLRQGNPLSATAMCRMNGEQGTAESPCPPSASSFLAVDGAFKVPGLRNVELTAPYFHNGGHLTLESVVDFYSRGGDFGCSKYLKTPCGTADAIRAVNGTEIAPLGIPRFSSPTQGLTQTEKAALVAFLKTLTDDRVKYRKAPFDHPQIFIPHGQLNDELTAVKDPDNPGQARDRIREIPAVGKNGGSPLPLFGTYK
jgi:cytochrome c peroxidase